MLDGALGIVLDCKGLHKSQVGLPTNNNQKGDNQDLQLKGGQLYDNANSEMVIIYRKHQKSLILVKLS